MREFMLILLAFVIGFVTQCHSAGDHVSLLRCAEHMSCFEHMDEAVIAVLHGNMHNTSDPCENFWEYACGEWTAAPYYDHVDNFGAAGNYYAHKLQKYLTTSWDATVAEEEHLEVFKLRAQLQLYYATCVGTRTYYLELPEYLAVLVARVPALQWPRDWRAALRESMWPPKNFNWLAAVAELRRYGLRGVFLDESVGFEYNDAQNYVMEVTMPSTEQRFTSKQQILRLLEDFGWLGDQHEELVKYETLAIQIYELELQLQVLQSQQRKQKAAKVANEVEEEHLPQNGADEMESAAMTLQQLEQRVPSVDWRLYFRILLQSDSAGNLKTHHDLTQLHVTLSDVSYMRALSTLLSQVDQRTVGAYILLRLCHYLQQVAPQITANNCIEHMGALLPLGLDYIYDRFIYETRAADEAALTRIFQQLKSQFAMYLAGNKMQLSPAERAYLLEKLTHMQLQVGNLPAHMSTAAYDHYYARANLSATSFYHNHLEMLRFRTAQQHAPLLAGAGRFEPTSYYINDDVQQPRNAPYFVHQRNLLIVPYVFLQLPFFHHRLQPLLQYSLTGWILAHELNHAFESVGIVIAADGSESPLGASIRAKPEFVEGVECLARTPTAALIERIADVNGFQLAYDAYFGNGEALRTPVASRHLYFLNFAQFFCGSLPRAIAHDRDDVRVIETLANMPEFGETFHCRVGQRERPVQPCQMWRA